MQRQYLSHLPGAMCVILTLLISGCAPINPPSTAAPGITLPAPASTPRSSSTPHPGTRATPEITPTNTGVFQSTAAMATTIAPTGTALPAGATCSKAGIDQYMNAVLPLADDYAVDAYEARKMEAITDETQIQALRERAAVRLESLQGIPVLPCLREAHEKLTSSFELLISSWDSIGAKDYSTATTALQTSYEALSEGLAKISILQQGW